MERNIRGTILSLVLVFVIGISPALAISNLMALQGIVEDSGQPLNGNLTITIYNQSSGGALIYNSGTEFNNKIVNGRFDVMLGQSTSLTLEYGKYYYLDMSVNGQDLDFNGSERQILQSSSGMISKSYVYPANTWQESEIPSLTSSWTGTVDSSKISGSIPSANNSQYLGGLAKTDFLNNDTQISSKVLSINTSSNIQSLGFNTTSQLSTLFYSITNPTSFITSSIGNLLNFYNRTESDNRYLQLADQRYNETGAVNSKATPGTCSAGQVVQNTTAGGVQCISTGIGTVTQISATAPGLSGGTISTTGTLTLNMTYLNTLYLGLTDQRYNETSLIGGKLDTVDQRYNETLLIGGKLDVTDQRYNETSAVNAKAAPGTCASGQVVQNTTTSGVQCISAGAGTVTQITATSPGLLGGIISTTGSLTLNTTYLNSLYLGIADQRYNETSQINGKLDAADQRYNETSLISGKLDITDQRYNETSKIPTHISNLTNDAGYITDGNSNWDNAYDFINSTYGNNAYIRIGTSCQCSNISDRMYNFTVNANGLCIAICGIDTIGDTSSGPADSGVIPIIKMQVADVSNTDVTAWIGTNMDFDVIDSKTYTLVCDLMYTGAAATTGQVINLSTTAGVSNVNIMYNTWSSATAPVGLSSTTFGTALIGTGSGAAIVKPNLLIADFGVTSRGSVNLSIRSEVNISETRLVRGSTCMLYDRTNISSAPVRSDAGSVPGIIVQTADVSTTNSTVFSSTNFSFPLVTSTTYTMMCDIMFTGAAATTGQVINLSTTAGVSNVNIMYNTWSSATANVGFSATTFGTALTGSGSGGAVVLPNQIIADFAATTTGTLDLRIRSEVSGSATTLVRGSMCRLYNSTA